MLVEEHKQVLDLQRRLEALTAAFSAPDPGASG
jgi:hypothetical protein